MRPAKLTPEQVEEIAELREHGWSYERIARRFGVSQGAVRYRCLCAGAVSPRTRPTHYAPVPTDTITYTRPDGTVCRRFTAAEDRQMIDMRQAGQTVTAIARALGRGRTSIAMRLLGLAQREEITV